MSEPTAPLVTFIPWSPGGAGLHGELTEAYVTSFTMGQIIPKAHQPLDLWVVGQGKYGVGAQRENVARAQEKYAILEAGGAAIVGLNGDNNTTFRTQLDQGGRILDFIALKDSYLLLRKQKEIFIERVEMDGAMQWSRFLSDDDLKDADQLLWNGQRLFVTSGRSQADLLEIDPGTGNTIKKIVRDAGGKPSVLIAGDRVLTVAYFPEARKRGISIYDLNTGEEDARPFDNQWYGPLATAIGADDQNRVTMFTIPAFGAETGLLRLDGEGKLDNKWRTIGFATGTDHKAIYSGNVRDNKLTVQRWQSKSMEISWEIPVDLLKEAPKGRFEYAGPDASQSHQFYFRDDMGYYHSALSCGSDGKVEVRKFAEGEIITRMQPASTWLVQSDGAVLIPVTSAKGLSILRIEI